MARAQCDTCLVLLVMRINRVECDMKIQICQLDGLRHLDLFAISILSIHTL
jgi:hypothetical protein